MIILQYRFSVTVKLLEVCSKLPHSLPLHVPLHSPETHLFPFGKFCLFQPSLTSLSLVAWLSQPKVLCYLVIMNNINVASPNEQITPVLSTKLKVRPLFYSLCLFTQTTSHMDSTVFCRSTQMLTY